jgi:predicted lipoprotein with Yx(FWY)xxD motif
VYTLSGDTTRHPKCTKASGCFSFWPPVTVSSAKSLTKAAGVKGKLGTFKRNGIIQVTLSGHPLYTFANDRKRAAATGEGVNGFGGIWHVVKESSGGQSTGSTPTMTTPTTTTSPYPGY